jgi:2'-hydroxyisoflavone reductase
VHLLVIGGTSFIGRHTVEQALAAGHDVTVFHRGSKDDDPFPEAEHLHGDRDGGLEPLAGRDWDALLDTCGYLPRVVRASSDLLAERISYALYVSSCSVYDPARAPSPPLGEDAPLATMDDPSVEEITETTYGPLKVLCEEAFRSAFGARAAIVRPTYVAGPFDPTDRFTYWVRRIGEGGTVLAPGPRDAPFQAIDVRDLGAFQLHLLETATPGTFNGVGPAKPLTFEGFLDACANGTGSPSRMEWVDPEHLLGEGLIYGEDLPLWDPPEDYPVIRADPSRATTAGLRLRPMTETVEATAAWDRERGLPPMKFLDRARETRILAEWGGRWAG